MAQNYIECGDVFQYTNATGATITAGTVVKIGSVVGVALVDIADGATGSVMTEGVFSLPKATGAGWSVGDTLYWDDTAKKFTKTDTGNTFAGYAFEAAASGDTTGLVKLWHAA